MTDSVFSRRRVLLSAAFGLGAVALGGISACSKVGGGASASSGKGLLETMKQRGSAKIGVANELPYSFAHPDGTVDGVEPEIAQAVLKRLGVGKVEPVVGTFAGMIPGLQAGQMDMVCAALFMKQSRCATIIFAEPDAVSDDSLAVAPGNPLALDSLAKVATSNARLSVVAGTLEAGKAGEAHIGNILTVQDHPAGVDALKAGRVDAHLGPTLTLKTITKQAGGKIDIAGPVPEVPVTGAGVAFRKQDEAFRTLFNQQLDELKKSGEFATILSKWGFDPALAIRTTANQLCQIGG
jgi:polar amino acid transport system substrate-binding protein